MAESSIADNYSKIAHFSLVSHRFAGSLNAIEAVIMPSGIQARFYILSCNNTANGQTWGIHRYCKPRTPFLLRRPTKNVMRVVQQEKEQSMSLPRGPPVN